MPKYIVTIEFSAHKDYEVEAETQEEAEDEVMQRADVRRLDDWAFDKSVLEVEQIAKY
ncbi:MAG: hypothetical protein SNJ79_10095 [Sphingomonadaceae bacterium]